ncbi:hypothetical protein F8M41_019171 [Gigaspora margarita]|uniref:Uncharacterized protein n=1 Tax=Gigaspora margarita TaxID=4874 RepID=A0A8H4EU16_GIGMA|nr:hypothetical protein F8M41_019171 [Gigaspora margarita]
MKNSNNLIIQNNGTLIVQVPKLVLVKNFNEVNYTTKEEIEEVIETKQVLPLVQSNKRKRNKEKIVKKQKISSISLNTKKSVIDLNI